jgi:hypothetical protein
VRARPVTALRCHRGRILARPLSSRARHWRSAARGMTSTTDSLGGRAAKAIQCALVAWASRGLRAVRDEGMGNSCVRASPQDRVHSDPPPPAPSRMVNSHGSHLRIDSGSVARPQTLLALCMRQLVQAPDWALLRQLPALSHDLSQLLLDELIAAGRLNFALVRGFASAPLWRLEAPKFPALSHGWVSVLTGAQLTAVNLSHTQVRC